MAETGQVAKVVEKAVAQVLESHLPQLQRELVELVQKEIQPGAGAVASRGAEDLLKAITVIHGGATQKEILRALLESTTHYC
ncbi:MAG TPA: hypothetical protein VEI49_05490, partial [Terriglobales bacterium]|nr:hypothetical protein [Terriglobales bacterium]